jgi:hypothetical protein
LNFVELSVLPLNVPQLASSLICCDGL